MHCLQGNPSSPPIRPLPTFQTFRLSSSKYNLLMFWCCTHTCHSLESLVPGPTHFAWYISISNPYSGFSSSLAFFPCQNNQYWVTLLTYLRYTVYCITSTQIQYSKIQHHNYHWIYFSFSCVHAVVYTCLVDICVYMWRLRLRSGISFNCSFILFFKEGSLNQTQSS